MDTADGSRCQLLAQSGVRTNGSGVSTTCGCSSPIRPKGSNPRQQVLDDLAMPEFTETIPQIRSQVKINNLSHIKAAGRSG
jgi:hypothetical protein